jgi:hypothetical protein
MAESTLAPSPAARPCDGLSDSEVAQWRDKGYLLLDGLLPAELARAAHDAMAAHYRDVDWSSAARDFGSLDGATQASGTGARGGAGALTLHTGRSSQQPACWRR